MQALALLFLLALLLLAAPDLSAHPGHETTDAATAPDKTLIAARTGNGKLLFETVPGWCQLPAGQPIGNTHGQMVIDHEGRIYINSDGDRSVMVYSPEGKWLRSFAPEWRGIHGMQLVEENGQSFIYAAHLRTHEIVKLTLSEELVWRMGYPQESGRYGDAPEFKPTGIAVAPTGDIYVADGYGASCIHQFDAQRRYVRTFGERGKAPGQLNNCHGIALDSRGEQPLLLVCDRENHRLQHFDLEGNFVRVAATNLRRPCSVAFFGDLVAVAELQGRVTLLDRDNRVIAHLGDNPDEEQWAKNKVPQEEWRDGIFTAPHSVCFDRRGDLYVMDWNYLGRITKLARVQ